MTEPVAGDDDLQGFVREQGGWAKMRRDARIAAIKPSRIAHRVRPARVTR